MKFIDETSKKYLKLIIRIIGVFWIFIGFCYLIGHYFTLAVIEIISGAFFVFLPNIIKRFNKWFYRFKN